MDFITMKTFYVSKDIIKKVKTHPTKQEKIYANHISDKSLLEYMRNSYNSTEKTQKPNLKIYKGFEQSFLQRRYTHGQ